MADSGVFAAPGLTAAPVIPTIPMPAGIPAPTATQLTPSWGVNPYTRPSTGLSSLGSYGSPALGVDTPTVINTLGIPVPDPSMANDPQALMDNITSSLAKLQTVNPQLAAEYQQKLTGGQDQGGGGGLFGFLGDIKDAVLGGAGKVMDLLGRTAHLVPAFLDPESWDDGNGFNNAWDALMGRDTTNWNEVFQHWGWEGDGLSGTLRAALGFVGDIATDPLTYATFGAGAGATAAEKGALAGKEIAVKTFAEKGAELGLGSNADEAANVLEQVFNAMKGAPGKSEQALQSVDAMAGRAITDAHKQLVGDMMELADNVYNGVYGRTFGTFLRKGETMTVGRVVAEDGTVIREGTQVAAKDMKAILEEAVKNGAGKAPKSAEWLTARASAGAMGGVRFAPYIPFTSFRYISPMIPGSNAIQPLARMARFAAGLSSSKYMEKLVRAGEANWDDMSLLMQKGLGALKDSSIPRQRKLYSQLTSHGKAASAFYTASERMGQLTAHFAPGAKYYRKGLGYYFAASAERALKYKRSEVAGELYKAVETGSSGLEGRDYVLRMARDTFGKDWSEGDQDLVRRYLDHFGGLDDVPLDDPKALDEWFWARPDVQAQLDSPEAIAQRAAGEKPDIEFELERQLADMHDVATNLTGNKRRVADLLAQVERHGNDVVNEYGAHAGDARYVGLGSAREIHPDDVSLWNGSAHADYRERKWYATPTNTRQGLTEDDVIGHGDLGVAGVRVSNTPSDGAVEVAVNPRKVLIVGEGDTAASKVLTDDPIVQEAMDQAEAQMQALKQAADEQGIPLIGDSPLAAHNWDRTKAELVTRNLKERGGLEYDAVLFRGHPEGDQLVLLGTKEVDPWDMVKEVNPQAARARATRGYFHRTFRTEVSEFLHGVYGDERAVHAVKDLSAKVRRRSAGKTFDAAEKEARSIIRDELVANGASEQVLRDFESMPIFERDPLKAHQDYVDNVAEAVVGLQTGELAERMNSLGQLRPERFGRVMGIDQARWQVDQKLISAVAKGYPDVKAAAESFHAKERKLMVAMQRQLDSQQESLAAVLDKWARGEDVDLASLAVKNPRLQRLLDAADNKAAVIAAEREKALKAKAALDKRMADLDAVEKLVTEQLGWSDDMVIEPLGDGRFRIKSWHGTHRGGVAVEGPDSGTQFAAGGLHSGPKRAAEDRIGSNDVGMFDIVDDTTGETVDTVEGRFVEQRKAELAQEARDDTSGMGGGQDVSNYSHHALENDEPLNESETLFPVQFEGRVPTNMDGEPMVVPDAEAHFFGEVMQGKLLAVKVELDGHGNWRSIQPLHTPEDVRNARAMAGIGNNKTAHILDATDLAQYDGIVYRNAIEGGRPGEGKALSMLTFQPSVEKGVLTSPRESIEEALRNGDLGIHADGSVTTRAGRVRQAGKGGARRVYPRAELTEQYRRVNQTLHDLDQVDRQRSLEVGLGAEESALPKRVLAAQKRVERATSALGGEVEQDSAARAREAARRAAQVRSARNQAQDAFNELNKAIAASEGFEADLTPAIVFPGGAAPGGRSGMRQVNVAGLGDVWMHEYVAEEWAHIMHDKPVGALRGAWREFVLTPWKKFATYLSPGFHVRNTFGAWFNNHLGGVARADYDFAFRVLSAKNPESKWAMATLGKEEFERLGLHHNANFAGLEEKLTYGDVATMMSDFGIGRAQTTSVELISQTAGEGARLSAKNKVAYPFRKYNQAMRATGAGVEDFFRTAAWAGGMRATRGDVYGARAFVMLRHGDYADLTDTEEFIKDLVPFYKWMRTNVPYQLRMLAEEPGKLLMVQKAQQSLYDAFNVPEDQQRSMPDWMKGRGLNIPLPFLHDEQGKMQFASMDLPYGDLYKGTREYLSTILPVVSDVVESTVTHTDTFTGQSLDGVTPVGGLWGLPGLKQLMSLAPGAITGPDGQVYIPKTVENVLSAIPVYGRFRDWVSADPNRVEKRWGAITSFFGGTALRSVDLNADEQRFYYDILEPTLKAYQDAGYVFPTKDQLTAAGRLAATPTSPLSASFPSGVIGPIGVGTYAA